ncbi:MAG: DSD1 family PLP-dependent enzyme [Aestuariivirgaceae bacterium]
MHRDQTRTPALIVDCDALDRNIATMAAFANAMGVALRPHAKSHKSPEIARRLAAAGAVGSSCATIDEAEALASGGIAGILITSPIAAPHMFMRLGRLLARGADVMVVTDSPRNVAELAAIADTERRPLSVIVEIDVGVGRTGCLDVADAVDLAKEIAKQPTLRFAGVQGYWGNLQQVMPFAERKQRVATQADKLHKLVTALRAEALAPPIVTGGGTGTHWLDVTHGVFTELQPGSYLFLDSCYGSIPVTPDGNPFVPSLFVAASVVSANRPGRVIVNSGYKAFATDSGMPKPMRGVPPNSTYRFMGDEHGAIDFEGAASPAVGTTIELLTSHCDPTVNLYASLLIARGEEIVDEWPIMARGY